MVAAGIRIIAKEAKHERSTSAHLISRAIPGFRQPPAHSSGHNHHYPCGDVWVWGLDAGHSWRSDGVSGNSASASICTTEKKVGAAHVHFSRCHNQFLTDYTRRGRHRCSVSYLYCRCTGMDAPPPERNRTHAHGDEGNAFGQQAHTYSRPPAEQKRNNGSRCRPGSTNGAAAQW